MKLPLPYSPHIPPQIFAHSCAIPLNPPIEQIKQGTKPPPAYILLLSALSLPPSHDSILHMIIGDTASSSNTPSRSIVPTPLQVQSR